MTLGEVLLCRARPRISSSLQSRGIHRYLLPCRKTNRGLHQRLQCYRWNEASRTFRNKQDGTIGATTTIDTTAKTMQTDRTTKTNQTSRSYDYVRKGRSSEEKNIFLKDEIFASSSATVNPGTGTAPTSTTSTSSSRPLFPWRHETIENLLPRLRQGTPEYERDWVNTRHDQAVLAVLFLQVPMYRLLFGGAGGWRQDLADAAAWAFVQGVAGIVSNVYKVPFQKLLAEEDDNDEEKEQQDGDIRLQLHYSSEDNSQNISETSRNEIDVESIMSRPLRDLFRSAHEHGKDQMQIRLQVQPTSAVLYNLDCLPFVSREYAERNPSLLRDLIRAMAELRDSPVATFEKLHEFLTNELAANDGEVFTTVEMQVLVECDEIFTVTDRETGIVIQGSSDGTARSCVHLVRLESTIGLRVNNYYPFLHALQGYNWKIVDLDDMVSTKSLLRSYS